MEEVALSRREIAGAVAHQIGNPGFPTHTYISLENSIGFGEGPGGFGVGSVIDAIFGLESGFFGAMARIDELVLNIPDPTELRRFLSQAPGDGAIALSPSMKRELAENYEWVFAESVAGTRIRWE